MKTTYSTTTQHGHNIKSGLQVFNLGTIYDVLCVLYVSYSFCFVIIFLSSCEMIMIILERENEYINVSNLRFSITIVLGNMCGNFNIKVPSNPLSYSGVSLCTCSVLTSAHH